MPVILSSVVSYVLEYFYVLSLSLESTHVRLGLGYD